MEAFQRERGGFELSGHGKGETVDLRAEAGENTFSSLFVQESSWGWGNGPVPTKHCPARGERKKEGEEGVPKEIGEKNPKTRLPSFQVFPGVGVP